MYIYIYVCVEIYIYIHIQIEFPLIGNAFSIPRAVRAGGAQNFEVSAEAYRQRLKHFAEGSDPVERDLKFGSLRKFGVPYFGVLKARILLFRVLYWGPLFSETPIWSKTNWLLDRDLGIRCGREAEKDKQKGLPNLTPVERDWEFERQEANCSKETIQLDNQQNFEKEEQVSRRKGPQLREAGANRSKEIREFDEEGHFRMRSRPVEAALEIRARGANRSNEPRMIECESEQQTPQGQRPMPVFSTLVSLSDARLFNACIPPQIVQ